MDGIGTRRRATHRRFAGAATAALLAGLIGGCTLPPAVPLAPDVPIASSLSPEPAAASTAAEDGAARVVYTERGADGEPVEVLIVFDDDGRLLGTRSTTLAEAR